MINLLTQDNNQTDNQKDDAQLESEAWFLSSQNQWFLSKNSKVFLLGQDTWFVDPLQTVKTIHRINKKPKLDINKVEIKITKDQELLKQYYDLRDEEYKSHNGWVGYNGIENDFDRKANILLAVKDGMVIAGMRVSIPDTGYLSNEIPEQNFTYKEICKSRSIDIDGVKYLETSAVVIRKSFGGQLLARMFYFVVEHCRNNGIKYIFGVSTRECNRDYFLTLKKIGVKSIIFDNIEAPRKSKYNNVVMNPIIVMP
jgi:hypothetical protein